MSSIVQIWFSPQCADQGRPWTLLFGGVRLQVASVSILTPSRACFSRDPESLRTLPEGWLEAFGIVSIDPITEAATIAANLDQVP